MGIQKGDCSDVVMSRDDEEGVSMHRVSNNYAGSSNLVIS